MGNDADYHNLVQFRYYGRDMVVKYIATTKPIMQTNQTSFACGGIVIQ